MNPTRPTFFGTVAATSGALGAAVDGCPRSGAGQAVSSSDDQVSAAPQSLRVLILGGTGFIGPHMVEYALERGHSVTIFNRGRTNPHLFPEVEKLVGDRDGQLEALEGRNWDVVLDNSGYVPRHVRDSAQLLKDATDHYLFTSTAGVYASWYDENGTMKAAPGARMAEAARPGPPRWSCLSPNRKTWKPGRPPQGAVRERGGAKPTATHRCGIRGRADRGRATPPTASPTTRADRPWRRDLAFGAPTIRAVTSRARLADGPSGSARTG